MVAAADNLIQNLGTANPEDTNERICIITIDSRTHVARGNSIHISVGIRNIDTGLWRHNAFTAKTYQEAVDAVNDYYKDWLHTYLIAKSKISMAIKPGRALASPREFSNYSVRLTTI